jgi:hypothetical protein
MPGSLDRYRFQAQLGRQLEKIDDPTKLFKTALSQTVRQLPADAGGVVLLHPISGELRTLGSGRGGSDWDEKTVRAFLALERPSLPDNEIMAPILIGNRPIGVMALRRKDEPFSPGDGRYLGKLCRKLAKRLDYVASQPQELQEAMKDTLETWFVYAGQYDEGRVHTQHHHGSVRLRTVFQGSHSSRLSDHRPGVGAKRIRIRDERLPQYEL